jgi:ankyrin repeat protein
MWDGSDEVVYYIIAIFVLLLLGIILLLIAIPLIKHKFGKILLGIALLCFIPFTIFKIDEMQSMKKKWDNLGPFFQAIKKKKYDKIQQLIDEGYDVNEQNRSAFPPTPLLYAIDNKDIRSVRLLIENGADINFNPEFNGMFPLDYAVFINDATITNYLLEQGAVIDTLLPRLMERAKDYMDNYGYNDSLQAVEIMKLLEEYAPKEVDLPADSVK